MVLLGNIIEEIRIALQNYFNDNSSDPNPGIPDEIVLGNVSLLDAYTVSDQNIQNNLVMSLVCLEEEKSLRFAKTTTTITTPNPNDSRVITHHPIIFLNLYLLFSSHNTDYKESLNQLSAVVNFFQRQHIFTSTDINLPETLERIVFELYTTSFEQMNHLWGVLGGKYIPSVLYKVRILPHSDIRLENGAGRILRQRGIPNAI